MSLKLDLKGIFKFVNFNQESKNMMNQIKTIHHQIHYSKDFNDSCHWLKLPFNLNLEEIQRIQKIKTYHHELEVLVVIGIGGSYHGTKACLDFLKFNFQTKKPEIIFAGHQLSGFYLSNLIKYLENKNWALNVVSKSGSTIEVIVAFHILRKVLENQFGIQLSKKRILVTTSKNNSDLLNFSLKNEYEIFYMPDNISGRFSVLSVVSFLPLLFSNININNILKGAKDAFYETYSDSLLDNQAYQYGLARFFLYQQKKHVEVFFIYEPNLISFSEWWRQLFSESEGKNQKSLLPYLFNGSTDLHSLGQYLQDGPRIFFETILNVKKMPDDIAIPYLECKELSNFNYLFHQKKISEINQKTIEAVKTSHLINNVPNIEITIDNLDEYHLGYLIYFFEKACIFSALLLQVNPFNQPGVELYKKNLLSLLKENKK